MSANNSAIVIGVSAVNTASETLESLDNKVKETTGVITNESNKIATATSTISEKFKASYSSIVASTSTLGTKIKENFVGIATTAAGLGSGITSLALSYGDLEKVQTRVDTANVTYQRSLQTLTKLQDSGKASAEQLALAQEDVRVKAEQLKQAQGDVSDAYTQFLANIPNQLIGFGVAAQSMYSMLGKSQTANAVSTIESTATYEGALTSMNIANVETTESTITLGNVMRTVFLSNPVTLPLVALGALLTAVAFNVGGLRDRFNDLGKMLGDLLPGLRPILDALGYLGNLLAGITGQSDDLTKSNKDLKDAQDATAKSADNLASSTDAVSDSLVKTKQAVQSLNDYLNEQNGKLADTYHSNLLYVESTGAVKDALSLSNDELNRTAEYLRKQASETENATQDNFNLVASHKGLETALGLSDAQLNKMAVSIREQQSAQDKLKASTDAISDSYKNMKTQAEAVKTALDALAEAQQRSVITQFGQQVGLSGTVSLQALQAAGFGNNASLVESANAGRLGGVFTSRGRVLDTGGQLYEDVIGIGKDTGTPHLLHKNEFIVPPSKLGNGGSGASASRSQPAIIQFVIDGKTIAEATVDDITRLQGKTTRLQAKTFRQRVR